MGNKSEIYFQSKFEMTNFPRWFLSFIDIYVVFKIYNASELYKRWHNNEYFMANHKFEIYLPNKKYFAGNS